MELFMADNAISINFTNNNNNLISTNKIFIDGPYHKNDGNGFDFKNTDESLHSNEDDVSFNKNDSILNNSSMPLSKKSSKKMIRKSNAKIKPYKENSNTNPLEDMVY